MPTFPNDPAQSVPPTSDQFGFQPEPEVPAWPKVIGIISIVWASLGLFCGVCGLLQMVAGSAFQPPTAPGAPAFQTPPPSTLMMVTSVLGLIAPVLLLIAGIMTVQRKAAGRSLHLVYAVVSIILTIVGIVVAMSTMDETLKQLEAQMAAESDPNAAAQMQSMMPMMRMGAYIGVAVSGLLGVAYPLFIAIWFGLIKRDPSELTRGALRDVI
ncbi:MAG: hypothetical protein KF768_10260 [Phycisphaeraceae bacterium]|nr:hypothetical protein [Phycisphaeraceae bacterium]